MIDGDDLDDVARQVVEALDNISVQAARGAASRAWVAEHHAPSRIAGRLVDIYRGALGARGAR